MPINKCKRNGISKLYLPTNKANILGENHRWMLNPVGKSFIKKKGCLHGLKVCHH